MVSEVGTLLAREVSMRREEFIVGIVSIEGRILLSSPPRLNKESISTRLGKARYSYSRVR